MRCERDAKNFVPNLPAYTYEELMMLDAGTWFNETSIEQARLEFCLTTSIHFYVGGSRGLFQGKMLERDAQENECSRWD